MFFKLSLATAIHNLKWVKITHICLIREQIIFKSHFMSQISLHVIAFVNNSGLIG